MHPEISDLSEAKRVAFIDLCSGAGGLSLGFQKAGFRIAVAVEYNACVAETYRTNFPYATLIQDRIENITGERLLDEASQRSFKKLVLAGGLPCQPFSQANHHKKGIDHPSASTVDHFVRLVEEVKPEAFLFENVTSFRSINKGKSMHQFLKKLKKLGYKLVAEDLLDFSKKETGTTRLAEIDEEIRSRLQRLVEAFKK